MTGNNQSVVTLVLLDVAGRDGKNEGGGESGKRMVGLGG